MRKKLLLVPLVLLLAVSLIAIGCAPTPPTPEPPTPTPPTPTPPAPPPEEVITWKFQAFPTVADFPYQITVRTAERITTMSGGRLVVEAYPGGAIWPATEELYGVDAGMLDMGGACAMYYLDKFPQCGLFNMIAAGPTAIQMFIWYMHGGGNELAERLWAPLNVKYVGAAQYTEEVWALSNRKLETVEDLRGFKMRCAGDGGEILHSKMGVATVFFPGGELYESTARGVIDGFEYSSKYVNWPMGFHEVVDYMYLSPSRQPTDTIHYWVNQRRWDEIGPDLQAIVKHALRSTAFEWWSELLTLDDEYLHKYIDYGVQVLPLPQVIEDEFLVRAGEWYGEKAAADPFFREIYESLLATRDLCERQGIR